jgi:hypothetical protein
MKDFKKIVKIGSQKEWTLNGAQQVQASVFCTIKYKEGKLSITGVVGPRSNGDCLGSCGQVYDSLDIEHYAQGWSKKKLQKFLDIWREWHLNDMCAYTPEMKEAGWDKLASKEIFKYDFSMTSEAREELRALKAAEAEAEIKGEVIPLDDRQKRLLGSPSYKDLYGYEQPDAPEFMKLSNDILRDNKPKIERKTLGWVRNSEHPDGLLGKELNGKKYGRSWYFHEVPQDVVEWLHDLPETDVKPAWH